MLNPLCKIVVYDDITNTMLELPFANNIEIERSRKNLTTTCKITLPRKMRAVFANRKNVYADINDLFKRGLRVKVYLGYEETYGSLDNLKLEFSGYIVRVGTNTPLEIFCEDEMWQLKQNTYTKAWKKVHLKELVEFVYKGKIRVSDIELGAFVIKDQSTAQVLDAIKKFGLQCYFDVEGVLVAEFAGSTKTKPIEVLYDFSQNVIDDDLEYQRKEDIRIKVKGISKLPTGKKIEFLFGDNDGDLRTLNFVNLDEDQLKKIVKKEIENLKKDGFKNGFTTFGEPYAEPGYIARIVKSDFADYEGSYLIQAVSTSFGLNGFRRKIMLERKLA